MKNYTLFLKKNIQDMLEGVDTYSFLNEKDILSNFMLAGHATYSYYVKKIPVLTIVEDSKQVAPLPKGDEVSLCITTTKNTISAYLLNLLYNNNNTILYLPNNEASFDIERTWNIIQKKRDLHKVQTLILHMESWSKMVYAYRAATSYQVETIIDLTY